MKPVKRSSKSKRKSGKKIRKDDEPSSTSSSSSSPDSSSSSDSGSDTDSGSGRTRRSRSSSSDSSTTSSSSDSSTTSSSSDSSTTSSSSSSSSGSSRTSSRKTKIKSKAKGIKSGSKQHEESDENVIEIKEHVPGSWEWSVDRLQIMCSRAINIAVREGGEGLLDDAAYTLRCAILLTKKSRALKDPRTVVILGSLRFTLEGIERGIDRLNRHKRSRSRSNSRSRFYSRSYSNSGSYSSTSTSYYNRHNEEQIYTRQRVESPVDRVPRNFSFASNSFESLNFTCETKAMENRLSNEHDRGKDTLILAKPGTPPPPGIMTPPPPGT